MPARLNLTGQRFGRLLVLADAGNLPNGSHRRPCSAWRCQCDCGKIVVIKSTNLRFGHTRSCGCLMREVSGARYRGKTIGVSGHRKDISGQTFGQVTAISYSHTQRRKHSYCAYWNCRCDCGKEFVTSGYWLRAGKTRSCGHESHARLGNLNRTHGQCRTPIYRIWAQVVTRCTNPNVKHFKHYGGRGITVCDRWRHSFENFSADIGPRPSKKHTLDRVDNEKGYSPDNVRWATPREQANNTRRNVRTTLNGVTKTRAEWSRILDIPYGLLSQRDRIKKCRATGDTDRQPYLAFVKHIRTAVRIRCYWCNKITQKPQRTIDHIIPIAKGGRDSVLNICCACAKCNGLKSDRLPEEFSNQAELFPAA